MLPAPARATPRKVLRPLLLPLCCAAVALVLLGCSGEGDATKGLSLFGKPAVPVTISWRETKLSGNTQVARIRPAADAPLPLRVTVEVTVHATGERKKDDWVLERHHVKEPREIGWFEGHKFVPGDIITVGHKDYAPVTATCRALP